MTTYLLIIISQLFLVTFCEKETIEPSNLSGKIEKRVVSIAKDKNIPSLELTITTEQDVINFNYNHKEVKKQSIYGIGSATKFLSAVLIFKLIEDENLNLNDKFTDYVNLSQPIVGIENLTVKNLLNHTSGLSDYTKNPDVMLAKREVSTCLDMVIFNYGLIFTFFVQAKVLFMFHIYFLIDEKRLQEVSYREK